MKEEYAIILIDRQSRNFVWKIASSLDNIADKIQAKIFLAIPFSIGAYFLWTADGEKQLRYNVFPHKQTGTKRNSISRSNTYKPSGQSTLL